MNDMNKNNTVLRFMTCGSVDDGKSTLIGRLLYDTKTILTDTLSQIEKTSKKKGMTALDLSLITDGLQAEDGIRDPLWSRGLGDVYKRQICD